MMRALTLFTASTLAAASLVVLTPENFDKFVGGAQPALVKFYAPWCGHCKSMAPAYEEAASVFNENTEVVVGKLDADAHKDFSSKFEVRGYPTLKWYPAGSTTGEEFSGGRSAEEIVSWINGKTGLNKAIKKAPTNVVDLSPTNFDGIVGDVSKFRFVEFFAPWCGHCKALAPIWQKLGAAFDGESKVVVAALDADKHRSLGERFGVKGFPTIKVFLPGQTEPEDYQGGRDLGDLVSFINEKAGTARDSSGGLLPSAGRLEDFDEFAEQFMKAGSAGDKAAVLAKATTAAGELSDADAIAAADVYLKAMAKVQEKGADYISKESARLGGMIASESIAKAKKAAFMAKKNVLAAFSEASA